MHMRDSEPMANRTCFVLYVPARFSFFKVLAVALCFFLPTLVYGQQKDVVLKILNAKNEPVPFASFTIRNENDTASLLQKVSDSAGQVSFTGRLHQTYQ